LASRHHSLEMTEVKDVIEIIQNFEEHTGTHPAFAFSVVNADKAPRLMVTATAYEKPLDPAGPVQLASAQFNTSTTSHRFLRDVVTHALYLLDAKLAWKEMQGE